MIFLHISILFWPNNVILELKRKPCFLNIWIVCLVCFDKCQRTKLIKYSLPQKKVYTWIKAESSRARKTRGKVTLNARCATLNASPLSFEYSALQKCIPCFGGDCVLGCFTRTKIRSLFFCFLPQLFLGLDNTNFFFSEFSDSGKLPPQAVESHHYIKKLFLEYRLLTEVCTTKLIFLCSGTIFRAGGGVVCHCPKIAEKIFWGIWTSGQLW